MQSDLKLSRLLFRIQQPYVKRYMNERRTGQPSLWTDGAQNLIIFFDPSLSIPMKFIHDFWICPIETDGQTDR